VPSVSLSIQPHHSIFHSLFFLSYAPAVASALSTTSTTTPPHCWGCFSTIDVSHAPSPSMRTLPPLSSFLLQAAVAVRTRWFSLPYGDQAIFARAGALRAAGGINPLPLMEDVDLVTRLRAAHGRPGIVSAPVKASPRRWLAKGLVRTSLRNWSIFARWKAGVSADVLAAEYYGGEVVGRRRPERRRGLLW
jgi:hypothetical protein